MRINPRSKVNVYRPVQGAQGKECDKLLATVDDSLFKARLLTNRWVSQNKRQASTIS